jgi:hypothetical protein
LKIEKDTEAAVNAADALARQKTNLEDLEYAAKIADLKLQDSEAQYKLDEDRRGHSFQEEQQHIHDKYKAEADAIRNNPKLTDEEKNYRIHILGLEEADAQLKLATDKWAEYVQPIGDAIQNVGSEISHEFVSKVVGATSVFQRFVGAILDGLAQILVKMAAMAVVSTILKAVTGGLFSGGGTVTATTTNGFAAANLSPEPRNMGGKVRGYADGGAVEMGSYVVSEGRSEAHKAMLDALGAATVTGNIRGRDSVYAPTTGGSIVGLTPGERILPPRYADIGRMINQGRMSPASFDNTNYASAWNPASGIGNQTIKIDIAGRLEGHGRSLLATLRAERIIDKKTGGPAL